AFRGLIEPSRYPTAFLMLDMSPQGVDVNVHPAKAEVRFRDGSMVHGTILGSIKRCLRAADLTPSILPRVEPATPAWDGRAVLPSGAVLTPRTPANSAERFADDLRQLGTAARAAPSVADLRDAAQNAATILSALAQSSTDSPSAASNPIDAAHAAAPGAFTSTGGPLDPTG
ncbi:MAG: hypothetical protein JNK34_14345, partial [Tabrizicola sp.]|nr:hypothetical protein [Tabrizicola sp.]